MELVNLEHRETRLKAALSHLDSRYEFVIIDCPPSLGLLTLNALTASHSVLIPTQAEYYSMQGLGRFVQTIKMLEALPFPSNLRRVPEYAGGHHERMDGRGGVR